MKIDRVIQYRCLDCNDGVERTIQQMISHYVAKHHIPYHEAERVFSEALFEECQINGF